jgi:phage-related protein
MSLDTFTPPRIPDAPMAETSKLSLSEAEFGDGYTQATPNGLNHIRRSYQAKWTALTDDEAQTIVAFMASHKGSEPFWYTVPRIGKLKVSCKNWSRTLNELGSVDVTAELVESFSTET